MYTYYASYLMKAGRKGYIYNTLGLFELIVSMLGFVPRHATYSRTLAFAASIGLSFYLGVFQPHNEVIAITYFIVSEVLYIGFIMLVLPQNGFRLWFRSRWDNEHEGYLAYEGVLGVLFFHNAMSIGYVSSSTENSLPFSNVSLSILIILAILFCAGFLVKLLAARVVSIEIYYWKDMFLGKKVTDFAVSGPYKYLSNPMYGIGQLPAYAAAIWYGSGYGLLAAFVNQALIFVFYYFFEKKFIQRTYLTNAGFS
jgi:protein-S-isoprenylcysteine O-methyltransferase Ste14